MSTRELDFRNFLATLPDASARVAVPKRVADIPQPTSTIGPVRYGNTAAPNGSPQELNPQHGLTPADIANAALPLRSAGQAGYNTAAALDRGDVGGAVKTALGVAPMMIPGSAVERLMGGVGARAMAAFAGSEASRPLMSEAEIIAQRKADAIAATPRPTSDPALFQPSAPRTDPFVRQGTEDMSIGPNASPGVVPRDQRGPYNVNDAIAGLMKSGRIFSPAEAAAARANAAKFSPSF